MLICHVSTFAYRRKETHTLPICGNGIGPIPTVIRSGLDGTRVHNDPQTAGILLVLSLGRGQVSAWHRGWERVIFENHHFNCALTTSKRNHYLAGCLRRKDARRRIPGFRGSFLARTILLLLRFQLGQEGGKTFPFLESNLTDDSFFLFGLNGDFQLFSLCSAREWIYPQFEND